MIATQRTSELQHFPLAQAYICLEIDCGAVGNSNSWCPACSSRKIYPLVKWIAELVEKVSK